MSGARERLQAAYEAMPENERRIYVASMLGLLAFIARSGANSNAEMQAVMRAVCVVAGSAVAVEREDGAAAAAAMREWFEMSSSMSGHAPTADLFSGALNGGVN